MSLLLIAMVLGANAQPSAGAPQSLSQMGCRQIAVIGAVRTPSRLDAPLRLRLLEVLVRVGGPNERAGKTISVIHSCKCSPCDKLEAKARDVDEYNLADVLRGRENGNPYVASGDIVSVPEADSVFVIGNVITQRSIAFREGMTVTKTIAMAGGVIRSSALTMVRIYRNSNEGPRPAPIIINLRAMIEGRADNLLLQPRDIIAVSDGLGHFQVPRMSPPTWDPPLPKWNPPLHPRKGTSGSTLIAGASSRGSTCCIDSA